MCSEDVVVVFFQLQSQPQKEWRRRHTKKKLIRRWQVLLLQSLSLRKHITNRFIPIMVITPMDNHTTATHSHIMVSIRLYLVVFSRP
jgi:hypothetical protein